MTAGKRRSGLEVVVRSLALALLGAGFLVVLRAAGLVDLERIGAALGRSPRLVAAIALAQIGVAGCVSIRYALTLRAFGIALPFRDVTAACVLGLCIAPWLPGSPLVVEAARLGILLRADRGAPAPTRLVAASAIDAQIGLFLFCGVGTVAGVSTLLSSLASWRPALAAIVAFLAAATVALACVPLAARSTTLRGLLARAVGAADRLGGRRGAVAWIGRGASRTARFAAELVATGAETADRSAALLPALIAGVPAPLLNGLGLFLAARAVGVDIPLAGILVSFPLLVLGSLLPLGVGGVGGYQLITVAVFGVFAIESQDATSAELLQTAVILTVNALICLPFLRRVWAMVRAGRVSAPAAARGTDDLPR